MKSLAMLTVRDISRNKTVFQQISTFYSKDNKDITQDKRDVAQDEKDIVGTKGTKQGHSGQKETIGTFEVSLFIFSGGSLARGITRGASERRGRFLSMKARFSVGLLTFNDMNDRQRIFSVPMSFIYISRRLTCFLTLLKTFCWFSP